MPIQFKYHLTKKRVNVTAHANNVNWWATKKKGTNTQNNSK